MTPTWGWICLIASGLIDVAWALSIKKADGFANIAWTAVSLGLLALFVVFVKIANIQPLAGKLRGEISRAILPQEPARLGHKHLRIGQLARGRQPL